jgi:DNA polymerase-4
VTLKARYGDFSTITRSRTPARATDLAAELMPVVRSLLDDVDCARGLRLVGVHASNLVPADEPEQGTLALDLSESDSSSPALDDRGRPPARAPDPARRAEVERAMDGVRERFGKNAVRPAALLRGAERPNPPQEE